MNKNRVCTISIVPLLQLDVHRLSQTMVQQVGVSLETGEPTMVTFVHAVAIVVLIRSRCVCLRVTISDVTLRSGRILVGEGTGDENENDGQRGQRARKGGK